MSTDHSHLSHDLQRLLSAHSIGQLEPSCSEVSLMPAIQGAGVLRQSSCWNGYTRVGRVTGVLSE